MLDEVRGILAEHREGAEVLAIDVEPQESCVRNPRSPMNWIKHPIRDRVAAAARRLTPASRPLASCHPAWPDTPVLNERGIPSITYGPGSKYCYWDEEYVPIAEYLQAIKVYAATAANWFRALTMQLANIPIEIGRGATLRCKGWRQEGILRMLENTLANGEKPAGADRLWRLGPRRRGTGTAFTPSSRR